MRHSAHGRAEALSIAWLLVSASARVMKLIGPPMVMGGKLLARVDLGVIGAEHRVGQRRADHGIAVAAHQHDGGVLAELLRQILAEVRRQDHQIRAVAGVFLISNSGTPRPRKPALCRSGRNFARVTVNGTTVGEWLCTTALTSGRTL